MLSILDIFYFKGSNLSRTYFYTLTLNFLAEKNEKMTALAF